MNTYTSRSPGSASLRVTAFPPSGRARSVIRMLLVIAGLAIAYFVTGRLLLALSAPPNGAVTTVWLPSGITVAALVLFGPWAAVGSFFGSIALDLKMNTPLPAALAVGLANAGSELLCYYLITARGRGVFSIVGVRDGVRLVWAASAASVVSAFVGITAYVTFGIIPAFAYWPSWMTWFGSTAVGIILITPFLVYSVRQWRSMGPRSRYTEFGVALTALVIAAYFWQGPAFTRNADEPIVLVVIIGLLWIAFRFPPAAMTLAVFSFAVSAVAAAVLRLGGEPAATAYISIFALQLMLGGIAMIGYLLAAMVADQKRATQELGLAHRELVDNARQAGMAEIATNVLHNVGNILNSVNISAGVVSNRLKASKAQGLLRVAQLMDEHATDLGQFLTQDEKGKLLPGYISQVAMALSVEHREVIEELGHLTSSIDHIKNVVATQQSYAGSSTLLELVQISDLVEDALRINDDALERHQVVVVKEFADVPDSRLDRTRIVQILVNLISNAKHAMAGITERPRILTMRVNTTGSRLRIIVEDEGEGISADNLTRIFSHGFTSRDGGHGFGLHSCALAAGDMGGTLSAFSNGPGQGASFTLELPFNEPQSAS